MIRIDTSGSVAVITMQDARPLARADTAAGREGARCSTRGGLQQNCSATPASTAAAESPPHHASSTEALLKRAPAARR